MSVFGLCFLVQNGMFRFHPLVRFLDESVCQSLFSVVLSKVYVCHSLFSVFGQWYMLRDVASPTPTKNLVDLMIVYFTLRLRNILPKYLHHQYEHQKRFPKKQTNRRRPNQQFCLPIALHANNTNASHSLYANDNRPTLPSPNSLSAYSSRLTEWPS